MFIYTVLFFSLAASCSAEQVPLHRAKTALPNSYIVKLKNGVNMEDVIDTVKQEVVVQETFTDVLNGFAAKLSEKALHYIRTLEEVEYVSENGVMRLPQTSSTGQRAHRMDQRAFQWALDRIDQRDLPLDGQYNPPNHGEKVEIWVFDTGIRASHNAFTEFQRTVRIAYDIDGGNGDDHWGQGTRCASIAAGIYYGTANTANIVVAKVISASSGGIGTWAAVIKALDIMAQTAVKPAVASISVGEGGANTVLEDAVLSTMDKGYTVVVEAGYSNIDACQYYPANFKRVITVGASTKSDTRLYGSNYGSCVDIFAPGKDITAAYIGDDYAVSIMTGTSEATAIVAGAAAILLSSQPTLTHDQVKAKLLSDASPNKLQEPLPAGSPNLLLYVSSAAA